MYVIMHTVMTLNLTDDQKIGLFKALANKSLYEVGVDFGFEKHYSNPKSIKAKVYQIYSQIKSEPEKFTIQKETVDLVVNAVSSRSIAPVKDNPKITELEDNDIKTLSLSNRDLTATILRKKLIKLDKSKKALDNISLPQLATTFGILFDKAQIIQGQATEHIIQLSKIDADLSPEKAMEMVLKMREAAQQ